jgi:serine/threonine protein kinase/dienelactone hydrolase
MAPARWRQILEICDSALELPPARRRGFLDKACSTDPLLRREVESLLACADRAEPFLEVPALEMAGSAPDLEPGGEELLPPGAEIGPYRIVALLGAGGMGQVYQARDTRLGRDIALKFLSADLVQDPGALVRFRREARAASALNHPNICTLHDIGEHDGQPYLVMELLDGESLKQRLTAGPLPVEDALEMAIQIADALRAAHSKGIVHLDLKPANLFLTSRGQAKILDFGLSRLLADPSPRAAASGTDSNSAAAGEGTASRTGAIMGTAAYMSPEQAEGKPLDARSDIFSLGAVLYEILTGRRAFHVEPDPGPFGAMRRSRPAPIHQLRAGVPDAFERIVNRCLEDNPEARYSSADELWNDLTRLRSRRTNLSSVLRQPRYTVPALLLLTAVAILTAWLWVRNSRIHWANTVALPEIDRLTNDRRHWAALRLVQQAERYLPGDRRLREFRQRNVSWLTVRTHPPGADVYTRDYLDVSQNAEWIHLGRTPIEQAEIPIGLLPYRITKAGFETLEGVTGLLEGLRGTEILEFTLAPEGSSPPGMIRVPARQSNMVSLVLAHPTRTLRLEPFWLDKYEVTNRQFKEFVDQGGYQKREYWKQPFVRNGRPVSWDEAVSSFVDSTGQPGPATWAYGSYPKDQDDFPVGGVSWYEAAAYAEFAGKSLPTVHHWRSAAGLTTYAGILQVSNFFGEGPARAGSHRGLSPYGNYDMAGNVREWCWNPAGQERYALGGAWYDASYTFYTPETRPPMDRDPGNGFRCARYGHPPSEELTGAVPLLIRDRRGDVPVSDAVFEVYRTIHQYDRGDLKASIDEQDDTNPGWRLEKVSFQAAYRNERVNALLYLPKNAAPPYQVVVYFPGAYCLDVRVRPPVEITRYEYLLQSGRALMYPTYKGTFDRSFGGTFESLRRQPNIWREMALEWASDLGRSLDYLETRPDIDAGRMAYLGNSLGAVEGVRLMALNPRLKTAVLLYGGFWERGWPPAEVDSFHFAPRVKAPVLMVNGRDDFIFPLATSQTPLFRLLGAPPEDKRHFVVNGGHGPMNQEIIREILAWLDRYLGPVNRQ